MDRKIPAWLMSMINAKFNTTQKQKEDEKGYFCVNCGGESLTKAEKEKSHNGHEVLQAYNTSRKYGYKNKDILKLGSDVLDVSKIRAFAINKGYVYFPKSRSDNGTHINNMGRPGYCKSCGYAIGSPQYLYCSIMCKVVKEPVMNNPVINIGEYLENKKKKKKKRKIELQDLLADVNVNINVDQIINTNNLNIGFRKRGRKGIPRRAPFF